MVNRENVLAEKAAQQENNMFSSVSAEPAAAGKCVCGYGVCSCLFVFVFD